MTQWITSVLHRTSSQRVIARVVSDGLALQILKTRYSRLEPPFLLTLDLRSATGDQWIRVAEIRGDTPQACAASLGQIISVARQCVGSNSALGSAASLTKA